MATISNFSIVPVGAPETQQASQRWGHWHEPSSTATVTHSVDNYGVCTVIVGGTAMPPLPAENDPTPRYWNSVWYANAGYQYTAKAGKTYAYTFEAWTDGADRLLNVQWYKDDIDGIYLSTGYDWMNTPNPPVFKITSERKEYTVTATEPISKTSLQNIKFQCANQTGKFYVTNISIDEI